MTEHFIKLLEQNNRYTYIRNMAQRAKTTSINFNIYSMRGVGGFLKSTVAQEEQPPLDLAAAVGQLMQEWEQSAD